ncbi:hypothetical protein C8R41DRAFT_930758 [Lentinula lateritia]|uniref:Uncharacterized protein n=1 Tax=Lentinula lateritia TaxID=40482 RepID=A0ABQ8V1L1_9AGAR|nr:hypothetical protein C8R41DRAFT_930758 [Lentinula lateritia]
MTRNSAEEQAHAIVLLYNSGHVIAVIPQTFVYGIYTVLIPVSSYVMLYSRRGLATRARKILFGMTIFMFKLSTTHWIASIATLIRLIQVWFLAADPDARICPHGWSSRLACMGVMLGGWNEDFEDVSVYARSRYGRSRTEIRNNLDTAVDGRSRAGKNFVLLIETGALYSVSCLTVLMSSLIPLKGLDGTVADLYTPVSTQLAGIYPVVVLLLITQDYTLDRTVRAFASGGVEIQTGFHHSGQLDTMRFHRQSMADLVSSDMEENRSRDCRYYGILEWSFKTRTIERPATNSIFKNLMG